MELSQLNKTPDSLGTNSAETHAALPCFLLLSSAAGALKKSQSPTQGNN